MFKIKEIFLGEAIKKRRLELGLTQEKLCSGICEPITISRLENGKQTPSRRTLNALLNRLDMPNDKYYALLTVKELKIEEIWDKINACNVNFNKASKENRSKIREEAINLHNELIKNTGIDDNLLNQYIIRSQMIIGKSDCSYILDEQYEFLLKAIKITSPNFDIDDINKCIYSFEEIKTIRQLAIIHIYKEEHMEAIGILSQLYKYIKNHFHKTIIIQSNLNMIIYNYANELCIIGQYAKSLELAKEGRKLALRSGNYQLLPETIALMAECYHFLGDDNESKEFFYQAYYLMKTTENESNLDNLIKDAQQLLNINLAHPLYQQHDKAI